MIKQILLILISLGSIIGGYSEALSVQVEEQSNEIFIHAENAKIFCRTIGKGNPLIVIHGGPGSGQDHLLPQFYALAKNNFVIFYDQRGAGKSTGEINEDTMSVSMFVKDLEVLRKAFNYNKVSLLGHSWGSFVAMCYAIEHPEHVEKLVLSNPCPASYDDFSLFEKNRAPRLSDFQEEITKIQGTQDYQNGNPELYERVLRIITRTYCHKPEDADLLNLRLSRSEIVNATKIHKVVYENILEKHFDLYPHLKTLRIRTLIIHGDDDPIPLSTAKHIHESILGSKYIVLDDCGHYPHVEQPESYFKSLNEFLK